MGQSTQTRDDDFTVRSLVLRERFLKDTYQWAAWRDCYHPDSDQTQIETAWIIGTIDDFVRRSIDMKSRVVSRHLIQPMDANIRHNKAIVKSYGHVSLRMTLCRDEEYEVTAWGWWSHRAVCLTSSTGERKWRLISLRFIYDRDLLALTDPFKASKAQREITFGPNMRTSYKHLDWALTQLGYEVLKDLAGTDRPESVQEFWDSEERWLAE